MDIVTLTGAVLSLIVYLNTLNAGFVYDDRRAILSNPDVMDHSKPFIQMIFNDFWGSPLNFSGSHGSYRPLVTLTYRLTANYSTTNSAFSFHLTNVLIHCLATVLLAQFSKSLRLKLGRAGVILFAVHPIHCEAVAGIVGRADLMASAFFIAGLLSFQKYRKKQNNYRQLFVATLVFATASFLSKEYGIVLPVVCVIYDVIHSKTFNRKVAFDWAILLVFTFVMITARLWLSNFQIPWFSAADNPIAANPSFVTRSLTFLYLPVFHFKLMLYPRRLSFDWSMDSIAPIETLLDRRNFFTLFFYFGLALGLWKGIFRTVRTIIYLLLILVVTFLPSTNLIAYVGFVAAERILYLPSIAFCLIVSFGYEKLLNHQPHVIRKSANTAYLVLIIAFTLKTYERNNDWANEERLYKSAISINPAKAFGNLGVVFSESGRLNEAEFCFRQALKHRPNMADVHFNLGNVLSRNQKHEEALTFYNNAIRFRPKLADAYLQKAKVLLYFQRTKEAKGTLNTCVKIIEERQRDLHRFNSARVQCLLLSLELLGNNSNDIRIERFLKDANVMQTEDSTTFYRIGEVLLNYRRFKEAAIWLVKAAELKPESVSFALAAGHALLDAKREVEAESMFRRAVSLDPSEVSHRVNLGAVLHVQGKYEEAQLVYQRILQVAPNHAITKENLHTLQRLLDKKRSRLQFKKNQSLCTFN